MKMQLSILTTVFLLVSIGTVSAVPLSFKPKGICQWSNSMLPCTLVAKIVIEAGDSCLGRCNMVYDTSSPCQCNTACFTKGDCCTDYTASCTPESITAQEILDISSKIWTADVNRLAVGLDWQGTTDRDSAFDNATGPLCTGIPPEINTTKMYSTLQSLFDIYIPNEDIPENMSSTDLADIDAFLTEVADTPVMRLVNNFLASKSLAPSDPAAFRALIKEIWFTQYARHKKSPVVGSSGAEHVLAGETVNNNRNVSGLHNWVRFCTLENKGEIEYLGYEKQMDLGEAWVIRNPFYWGSSYKRIGGFFIGTSPAFDLSIFTLCFYARPNAICNAQLNGTSVPIQTYTMPPKNGTYVGSAFPVIPVNLKN